MNAARTIRTGMTMAALLGATLSSSELVRAASNSEARLAIHLVAPTTKNACSRTAARPTCANTVTAGGLYPTVYYAYLLVQNGDPVTGVSGLQCGIRYNDAAGAGIDIFTWTNCATLEFSSGGWPASNSGNLITWDSSLRCQRTEPGGRGTGVVATAGYFYLAAYSADALEIIPRPVDGAAKVGDCNASEYLIEGGGVHHDPSYLGVAAFSAGGSTPGYNPCATSDGEIDCTITGPARVDPGVAGLVYTAATAPPGSLFRWMISGNGATVGSTTGQSVSVTAGAAGNFNISVEVTNGASSHACSRTIEVSTLPPPTCTVGGPASATELTGGLVYNLTASTPIASVSWSITGNGTIVGPTNGQNATVTAGAPGAFDLTANVAVTPEGVTSCTKTVTVIARPPLFCIVNGATPVTELTPGLVYSVTASAPLASIAWSITGNGTIVGPTNGTNVSVSAGAPGAFDLTADVATTPAETTSCTKTVTVIAQPPLVCTVNGATPVTELTTGLVYSVTASAPLVSIAWSISGNGTIAGPTDRTFVLVTSGAPGGFDLTANVGDSFGRMTSCLEAVTVNPAGPPTCLIAGPASVSEGVTGLAYSVIPSAPVSSLQWSISGEGTITSGTTGGTVTVTAGNSGAFDLGVTVMTSGGASGQCSKTVTVNPYQCSIDGPGALLAGSIGNQYSAGTLLPGATYSWGVTGNAVISGSNTGPTITVTAGAPGSCEIQLDHSRNGVTQHCSRSVNVFANSPGGPNANAKLLVHLVTPTTKAQCTRSAAVPGCSAVNIDGGLFPQTYFAYLLVQDGNTVAGVAGLQCGIEYDRVPGSGLDIFSWTLCATTEFPSGGWPVSGAGNLITWDTASSCQRTVPAGNDPLNGVVANAGYFYLAAYTPDYLAVIPRPVDRQAKVVDCAANESLIGGVGFPPHAPSQLGRAAFGQAGGYNPCGGSLVPVQPTTWSTIKAQYGVGAGAAGRQP